MGRVQFRWQPFFPIEIWQSWGVSFVSTGQCLMLQTCQRSLTELFQEWEWVARQRNLCVTWSRYLMVLHENVVTFRIFRTFVLKLNALSAFETLFPPLAVLFGKPRRDQRNLEIGWKPSKLRKNSSRCHSSRQDPAWVARETGLQWQSQHPLTGIFWALKDWIPGLVSRWLLATAKWRPARCSTQANQCI